jgi:hypothetical protein
MSFRRHMRHGIPMCLLLLCSGVTSAQPRFEHSISVTVGAYAASGFGTNPYAGARYNYYFFAGKGFVEGALGFGSLRSRVLENVSKSQLFDTERLSSYEFVVGYDPAPSLAIPYVTAGVAGINQGGQSKYAASLGLGKRVPLSGLFSGNQLAFRYDIRDQIFSQSINNSDPFIAHNFVFTCGLQLFF